MKLCQLNITTSADGVENSIVREGEMDLSFSDLRICYREDNALVFLQLKEGVTSIVRKGDYTLSLSLKQGELTKGEIGIGGQGGEVETFTHRMAYSLSKNSILLLLHYDLIISGEKQEMKLRILSRFKEETV